MRGVALAAGLLAGPVAPRVTPPPAPGPAPADPLAQVFTAADRVNFSGRVIVDWVDNAGRHRRTLTVTVDDGVVDLDGSLNVVADADGRLVEEQQGWTLLWPTGDNVATSPARYADKYAVSTGPGPHVAGPPTTEVMT